MDLEPPWFFPKPLEVCPEIHVDLSMKPTFSKKNTRAFSRKSFYLQYFPKKIRGDLWSVKRNSQVLQCGLLNLFKGLFYNPKRSKNCQELIEDSPEKKHPNSWESSLHFGKRISEITHHVAHFVWFLGASVLGWDRAWSWLRSRHLPWMLVADGGSENERRFFEDYLVAHGS